MRDPFADFGNMGGFDDDFFGGGGGSARRQRRRSESIIESDWEQNRDNLG